MRIVRLGALLACFLPLVLPATESRLDVDSSDRDGLLQATIGARIPLHWDQLRTAVSDPEHWCRIATLVPDTNHCEYRLTSSGPVLTLEIHRRNGDRDPIRLDHELRIARSDSDRIEASLVAPTAPLGVRNAGVWISAQKEDEERAFVRLRYAYEPSMRSRLATGTYLNTAGRGKIGLSRESTDTEGRPVFIRGARALVERNAARYLVALEAVLSTSSREEALASWYESASRFEADLPERPLTTYLREKNFR